MRNKFISLLGVGAVVLVGAIACFAYSRMHRGGLGGDPRPGAGRGQRESQMLDAIDHAKPTNPLTPEDVISLHKASVPDTVIIAMIQKNASSKQVAGK